MSETDEVRLRYARRKLTAISDRYSLIDETVLRSVHERQRALARWVRECGIAPLAARSIIEVGCGTGSNLLDLLRLGAAPENLCGNELLQERCVQARHLLPTAVRLLPGDATTLDLPTGSFDVVLQSTVFSSILDDAFQLRLAECMWRWVRPGGGVLWYDFIYDNPRNPDVRGVPLRRIAELFPQGVVTNWRLTLAPPIARRIPASFYPWLNFPFLRTHVLCWIEKR